MYKLQVALMVLIVVPACGGHYDQRRVMDTAKRDAATYCSTSKEGCEFQMVSSSEHSTVTAVAVRRSSDGRQIYPPGDFKTYNYDKDGNPLGAIDGSRGDVLQSVREIVEK